MTCGMNNGQPYEIRLTTLAGSVCIAIERKPVSLFLSIFWWFWILFNVFRKFKEQATAQQTARPLPTTNSSDHNASDTHVSAPSVFSRPNSVEDTTTSTTLSRLDATSDAGPSRRSVSSRQNAGTDTLPKSPPKSKSVSRASRGSSVKRDDASETSSSRESSQTRSSSVSSRVGSRSLFASSSKQSTTLKRILNGKQ